ncbi:MAG TPA: adenylyl-sulfate kinase [Polyangiaceae bacterium]|jgi:adenylylsulfate kinase
MLGDSGMTIWLTGLPCSGKTTIAKALAERLIGEGRRVEVLDGDVVRRHLSSGLGFSREDRDRHVRRVGFVANLLSRNGVVVIAALVSPYRAVRDELRASIDRFVEVHVDCPSSECERRDVKGMYEKARAGSLPHFTGVDDPYERPEHCEVTLHTELETVEESTESILHALRRLGYTQDEPQPSAAAQKLRSRKPELGAWRTE